MQKKVGVLFTQAQSGFFAPTRIHGLIMRHLNRERIEVHLACTSGAGGEKPPSLQELEKIPDLHIRPTQFGPTIFRRSKGAILKSVFISGPASIVSLLGLLGYIKKHRIAIIHTGERPRDAFYGALLARLTGARNVIHVHGKYGDWLGSRVIWAMKHSQGIIGVSQFVEQSIIEHGHPADKVYHVLNSLNINEWDYTLDRNIIRKEFDIAPDTLLITLISRAVPSKGHDLLLRAVAKIKARVPCFKVLIVGDDDPGVLEMGRSYVAELKELTYELGLTEQVIFSGTRGDVQHILAASDLFAMPAVDEGFGLAFLEAMAMKKPVIALDSGGAPEVVEHGKAGLLSEPGNILQLAENIQTLLENAELRLQMGEYGRKRAEEYFNAQRMANDVEQIYQDILSRT